MYYPGKAAWTGNEADDWCDRLAPVDLPDVCPDILEARVEPRDGGTHYGFLRLNDEAEIEWEWWDEIPTTRILCRLQEDWSRSLPRIREIWSEQLHCSRVRQVIREFKFAADLYEENRGPIRKNPPLMKKVEEGEWLLRSSSRPTPQEFEVWSAKLRAIITDINNASRER